MPYFLYLVPVLKTGKRKNIANQISTLWRKSLKTLCRLPRSTPNEVITLLAGDIITWIEYFYENTVLKIQNRFGLESMQLEEL